MKYILNFGGGVNSTALLIEIINRKLPLDYVIFADTGSELPETYLFIQTIMPWIHSKNIPFITVKSKYGCSVYDYYFTKRTMPFRKFRDCTDKFKKAPITKFIKQFKNEGVVQYIGIACDEARRVRTSEVKWIEFKYPLVNWLINRKKCIEIIKSVNLPEPVKSGCFLCPYQSDSKWKELLNAHPDLFLKAREMEENNRSYPKNTLRWDGTLKQIEIAKEQQHSLLEWEGENNCTPKRGCDGFCML